MANVHLKIRNSNIQHEVAVFYSVQPLLSFKLLINLAVAVALSHGGIQESEDVGKQNI